MFSQNITPSSKTRQSSHLFALKLRVVNLIYQLFLRANCIYYYSIIFEITEISTKLRRNCTFFEKMAEKDEFVL